MTSGLKTVLTASLCSAMLAVSMATGFPLPPVEAAAQERRALSVIGEVVPRQGGILAAAISAPVAAVLVVAGNRVRAGQPLAQLDIADRRADLETARARISVAEAQIGVRRAALDVERANLRRQGELRGSAAFNAARLEDSQADVARLDAEITVARAQFEQARAQAARLLVDIERSKVLAPYDAVVTSRDVDAGDFVTPGRRMFALVNMDALEIEADVPTGMLGMLREGQRIEAQTRDGLPVTARVRAVIPVENPLTRTRTVRFAVEGGASLAVGQSVELSLIDAPEG